MKLRGVVLAGGTGSRLYPLTKVTNKHLLPIFKKPMIYYPIEKLVGAGIQDILIVTGTEHMGDMVSTLGAGKEFDCEFTYRVQAEPGGIAEALGLAKDFARGSRICTILGDNLFEDELGFFVSRFYEQKRGARILLKHVPDPERYGVAELDHDGNICSIEEKPKKPKSKYAITGIYLYDEHVFDIIAGLKRSARGEMEISDVNREYLAKGDLEFEVLRGWWTDSGTFESMQQAIQFVSK